MTHKLSLHKGLVLGRGALAGMPQALPYREATSVDLLTIRAQLIPRARTFPPLI